VILSVSLDQQVCCGSLSSHALECAVHEAKLVAVQAVTLGSAGRASSPRQSHSRSRMEQHN